MAINLSIIICGQAGQGVQTIGYLIAKTLTRYGYYVFAWQDFQSRIRGGASSFRLIISDEPINSLTEKYDILLSLDKSNTPVYLPLLKSDGIAVAEMEDEKKFLNPPLTKFSLEAGGSKLYINSAAAGVLAGILGVSFEQLKTSLSDEFSKKGEDIVTKNINTAKSGHDWSLEICRHIRCYILKKLPESNRLLISGNEAIALGSIAGGCKFISAYPMTPSTGIITYLAQTSNISGVLTQQAEDEIAAINMAIGASYAGARAMTATSGGGFSLMVEGLSLAAMTEIPIVVVLGQRPGPATGLPTRTEQGELLFSLHCAHGEFPRFIFAPSDAEDAFNLMIAAFDLSQKYRVPAIVLTDQYLADSYWTVENMDSENIKLNDYFSEASNPTEIKDDFKTFQITPDGISPRLKPGETRHLVIVDSDEHDEYGHITEDLTIRKKMVEKRWAKFEKMRSEIPAPIMGNTEDAQLIIVGWGSTGKIIEETAKILSNSGMNAGFVKYNHIWPLLIPNELKNTRAKILVVENNYTGQFAQLLENEDVTITDKILKYDGLPFTAEKIAEIIRGKFQW